jgi:hypothetical protein
MCNFFATFYHSSVPAESPKPLDFLDYLSKLIMFYKYKNIIKIPIYIFSDYSFNSFFSNSSRLNTFSFSNIFAIYLYTVGILISSRDAIMPVLKRRHSNAATSASRRVKHLKSEAMMVASGNWASYVAGREIIVK